MEAEVKSTEPIDCTDAQSPESPPVKKIPVRKVVKRLITCTAILLILTFLAPYINSYIVPNLRISVAKCMITAKQYKTAYRLLNKCPDNKEAEQLLYNFHVTYSYEKAEIYDENGDLEYTIVIARNKNGDTTSEIKYDKSSKEVYRLTYLYDEHGNQVEEKHESKNTVTTRKTFFAYDQDGNISERIRYDSDGKITHWNKYQYDSRGNKIMDEELDPSGGLNLRDEWEYDEKNQLIRESRYTGTGRLVSQYLMEYNECGDILKKTYLNGYYEYTYAPNGKLECQIHVQDGELSSKIAYQYDSHGNPTECNVYNSGWGTRREVYEYDFFGNMTMYELYQNKSLPTRDEYEYNHFGKLSRRRQYSVPNMPADTEYVYKYDLRGNLINCTGYDRKGNVDYSEHYKYGLWGYKTLESISYEEDVEHTRIESRYGILGNIRKQKEYRNGNLRYECKYNLFGDLTQKYGYNVYDEFGIYGEQEIDKLVVEFKDTIVLYDPD